jgi:hypothetical protein
MPYGLPPDINDFTGRSGALAELTGALMPSGSMPVAAVSGMGGVGKTALAVHVAHAVRRRFPGGRLYADLRGVRDRPAEPGAVLGGLLRALGRSDLPASLDERAALYRSELAGRRVLVLLDDACDPAQVRPLLPGAAGSAVLVTSRVTMAGLPGARLVDLDVLEPDEAVALLRRVAGTDRIAAERGAALDAVAACGFLPLAIRIVGARLAARPALSVGDLARRLARGRLDELPAAHACFQLGYDRLGQEQARAFRLLALADGPGFSTGAAAASLGLCRHHADDLVETLTDRSLLECLGPGRYRYHDLLRLFALREAETAEPPGERVAALRGLLDFHLASARDALRVLEPGDPGTEPATSRSAGIRPATPREAGTWLFLEHGSVLTAIERAAGERGGPLPLAADVLLTMAGFLDHGWNPRELEHAARAVRDAACRQGMFSAQARAECVLGRVHVHQGGGGRGRRAVRAPHPRYRPQPGDGHPERPRPRD